MSDKCKWTLAELSDMNDCWDTSCQACHCFTVGNIKDNEYKFCPYCGREIEEIKT